MNTTTNPINPALPLHATRTDGFVNTTPNPALPLPLHATRTDGFVNTTPNPALPLHATRCVLSLIRELQLYPILVAMAAGLIGAILSLRRGQSPFYGFALYAWGAIGVLIMIIFLVYYSKTKDDVVDL